MKSRIILSLIIVLLLGLLSVSGASNSPGEINVVVSIYPLEDITKNIGGERVNVKTLIPAGASPHAFEPSPSEIKALTRADVFIKIGAGLEFWAERFVKGARKNIKVLDLSLSVPLEGIVPHYHDSKYHGPESGYDPHYWLDPVIARDIVDVITIELIRLDPAWKAFYIKNASLYKKKLSELHEEVKKHISRFNRKEFVALHPAWNYFSKRYGLKPLYIIEIPQIEPRPQKIKEIVERLKNKKIKAVFSEPQINPQIAKAIAREAGVRVLFLDPIGSPTISGRDTYIDLILYNTRMLEEALR